ncbi:MAG: adenylate/guanylate cyclase domain-containing protein [Reyranella sp.]|nr:adenylate/guanylate cyclase domain-containing protein [Reyranella sp.]
MSGFAFAFKARVIALGAVVVWVVLSASLGRLPFLLGAAALFFVVGWIAYRSRTSPYMLAIQAVCALADVAIIVLASHMPDGDWNEWALQTWLRRSAFLYLVAYVASSALTFSVKVVLLSGIAATLGLIASFAWVLYVATYVDSFKGFVSDGPYDLLRQLMQIQNVEPWVFMMNQVVLLAITTCLIAGAIWRARRHVERAVQAEFQRANLGRFFSPAVANRLAEDVQSLDGGRAQTAAVLFVDIIGSTRRMEAFTPEQVIEAVRAFHQRIVPVVFRHNGSIDKFLGDGVMAVFGAPEKAPYDARDALLCAVEVLDTIDRWNSTRIQRGYVATTVALGLHYGPVIQGNVGIADRLEFTTLGDTVNVANRLEAMTRQHDAGILMSKEAMDAAERSSPLPVRIRARCRDLGVLPITGHEAPLHVIAIDRETRP